MIGILLGALLSGGASLGAGIFLFRRLGIRLGRVEEISLAFVAGSAIFSQILFFLCAVHAARTGVFVVVGIAAVWAAWRTRWSGPVFAPLPRLWTWFYGVLFAAFGIVYLANALAPEMSADGATYHLPIVAEYLRAHGFVPIPWSFYGSLSQGIELLFLPAFAVGRHSAAALVHFLFLLDLPLMMICYGRRFGFGLPACAVAFLVFAAPVVGLDGTSAYIDVALAAILFALLYLLSIQEAQESARLLIPIGMLAGFAYAAKYTGGIAIPYAVGFVLWKLRRMRPALIVAGMAAFFVLPWMIKNAVYVGNPVAPFANRLFPNAYVHVSFEQGYREQMRQYLVAGIQDVPREVTVRGERLQGFLGPVFLLLPAGLLALRRREGRRLVLAGVVFALPWLANIGTRFLIPALPPLTLALALALARPGAMLPALAVAHAVLSWYAAPMAYFDRYAPRLHAFPWRAALRIEPEEAYLARNSPGYGIDRLIERAVPPGESVLTLVTVPKAWTTRRILVAYEAARNEMLADVLWSALAPAPDPPRAQGFRFAERPVSRLRVVYRGLQDGRIWSVSEFRMLSKGRALEPGRGWHASAKPNRWDASLAFDGRRITRWRTWEGATSGMFVEVAFHAAEKMDQVRVWSDAPVDLETVDEHGVWGAIAAERFLCESEAPADLRQEATRALGALGIHYLLVPPGTFGANDFRQQPAAWGMRLAGESGETRLYLLSPDTVRPAPMEALPQGEGVPAGTYDDTDARLLLHSPWTNDTQFAEASRHSVTYSNIPGATAALAFRGNAVTYIYTRARNRGIAEVVVDGQVKDRLDLYSATTKWQSRRRYDGLGPGRHVLEIRVTGRRNPLASDSFVDVDALVVE